MKFDAALAPMHLTDVPAVAKAAEKIGFDCLWTSETQHNPFLPCTLIAEHTKNLEYGYGNCCFICALACGPGLHGLGSGGTVGGQIHSGAWHAGQGSHREALWDVLAGVTGQ